MFNLGWVVKNMGFSRSLLLKSLRWFCNIIRSVCLMDAANSFRWQELSRKGVLLAMARKSKRMALNDAIRQGQAKIAEGLKTGQMRSDGPSVNRAEKDKELFSDPENVMQNPVYKSRAFFLKSKEKSKLWEQFSPKMRLLALLCAATIVVFALGIWLISLVDTSGPPETHGVAVSDAISGNREQEKGSDFSEGYSDSVDSGYPETGSLPLASGGDNVICIQSIAFSRKEELSTVADFFRRKGIETEVIAVESPSGRLAVLVTSDGFEDNPLKKGADGYDLAQRIMQLGSVYVEDTKDMKFGTKPFQDVYGRKR